VEIEKSEGSTHRLKLRGNLELRGITKPVEVPVVLSLEGDRLTARGEMKLESDQWGVPQITAAAGSVKTSEELELAYEIVAVRK
ncbi:MAG: YceI family protein, partial [Vicinamibacteria bacterium]